MEIRCIKTIQPYLNYWEEVVYRMNRGEIFFVERKFANGSYLISNICSNLEFLINEDEMESDFERRY